MELAAKGDLAFHYFPGDYRWSHGLLLALNTAPWGGAEIGEVHRVGLELRDHLGDDAAWFRVWSSHAQRLEDGGRARLASGRVRSGASYLLRAANYYHVGERFLQPKTGESNTAYQRGVACFQDAMGGAGVPHVERAEIPYEGTSLPALFVRAEQPADAQRPAPAVVFFDGFDITKELQYLKGIPELSKRGIACLIVDGPGNGESIRFRGLALHHETERYATPAYEWLAGRPEVDETRIGVMGISLGGYYAPRAAAFESRFACCLAWGAQWDYHATWAARFARLDAGQTPALSVPWRHLLWILSVQTREEALAKLKGFTLEGVASRIRCPFLLVHGEGDEQVPLADARRCLNAVGSKHKTLRVFSREEGGYHHCQIDNVSIGVAAMWDWLEDTLNP